MKKLQNKKTGDIGVLNIWNNKYCVVSYGLPLCGNSVLGEYDTVDALMQEWKDYEEPKKFWYICGFEVMPAVEGKFSTPDLAAFTREEIAKLEDIGNYFETEKEAEKAVEKQVIWTTLEDSGFKFTGWKRDKNDRDKLIIEATDPTFRDIKDLDLLFSGEDN